MSFKELNGYSREEIEEDVINHITSADGLRPFYVAAVEIPNKAKKKIKNKIDGLRSWNIYDHTITYRNGTTLPCIANWGTKMILKYPSRAVLGQLLHLDFPPDDRLVFFIPDNALDKLKALPNINLAESQVNLLIKLANDLGEYSSPAFQISVKHPAAENMKEQAALWDRQSFDSDLLVDVFQKHPMALQLCIAAADVQLRSFLSQAQLPALVYNFILHADGEAAYHQLTKILQAMTFVNAPGFMEQGPISLNCSGASALDCCLDRMVLLSAGPATVRSLLKRAEETERLLKCGASAPSPFATVPLLVTRDILDSPVALDVELPHAGDPVTPGEQDVLRIAMSRFLTKKNAKAALKRLERERCSPSYYRRSGALLWRNILTEEMLNCWIEDPDLHTEITHAIEACSNAQELAQQAREQTLTAAVDLITHPDRYQDKIIPKPDTSSEARVLLNQSSGPVTLSFTPSKGNDAGRSMLLFSSQSLLRLLNLDRDGQKYISAILARCTSRGIWCERTYTVRFKDGTLKLIAFGFPSGDCSLVPMFPEP